MSSKFLLLDFLLPEILSRIFSFLHIEDRKQVRLVCRKWNDCCNCPEILSREKFIFRAGYSHENIDLFLRNCGKIRHSVEFQGLSLDKLSDDIWQIIGENIYSLKLFECTGTTKVTKNIILHCTNMHSFNLISYQYWDNIPFYSLEMWNQLIELNVERRKVIDFQFFVGGKELPKDKLRKIFKIFPSIRNFGTGYPRYVSYWDVLLYRPHEGSLHDTFDPSVIKELTFNLPCIGLYLQEFSKVPELRLQKLEIIVQYPRVSLDTFTRFLQNQRELKTLTVTSVLTTGNKDYSKVILYKILSICTELIDFRFKTDAFLKMEELYRVLRAVSESKLECFMIRFKPAYDVENLIEFHDNLSTYLPPLTNKRLRTLKLDTNTRVGKGLPEEYCLPILQHFCDLRHLEIAAVSDKVLQTIFKYHIHLQTLVLRIVDRCTAFGFTGNESDSSVVRETTYSISRLQELKHLELVGNVNGPVLGEAILHFNFPRLIYLRLSLWIVEKEEVDLQFLPARIPLVEVLIIEYIPLYEDEDLFLCQHLQRLKFLFYPWFGEEERKEEIFGRIFIARPSLKYAVDSITLKTYFYDCFSKALNMVCTAGLDFKRGVFRDFDPD